MRKPNPARCFLESPCPRAETRFPRSTVVALLRLSLLVSMTGFCGHLAKAQALVNGGNHDGFITTNHLSDTWTLNASAGDNVVLRLGTTNFDGDLKLYGPTAALLVAAGVGNPDTRIAYTATNSGTFTVQVSSHFLNGQGTYRLYYVKAPGAFEVADDGGLLTNGGNHDGTIDLADLDPWTLTASAGDNLVLRIGTTNFEADLTLYGPNGAVVASAGVGNTDTELDYIVTNAGTFTLLVESHYVSGRGNYRLYYAKFPGAFVVADDGGALTNGGNHAGTIDLGDLDLWSLSASAGDNLVLRLGTTNFEGDLTLYGPSGAPVASAGVGNTDTELDYTVTNAGTFTLLVNSHFINGRGTYRLHYARFPGAFVVADDGGALTNGGNHDGTIDLGDLDLWSFTANPGENLVLRLGTTNFQGDLSLYGPNGKLLATAGVGNTDTELDYTTTNAGTFTLLVESHYINGRGTYRLHYAKFPGAFVVADDGGGLTNGANHDGTIDLGDLDLWTFTASSGDNVRLRLGTTNFSGDLDLYGPNGARLASVGVGNTDTEMVYTATNAGTFTVLVSSHFIAGQGIYRLYYVKIPGAFVVADDGGPLTNGWNHDGTIDLGDLDPWTFNANSGETVRLRLGTINFDGDLDLYGPTGALVAAAGVGNVDTALTYSTTNAGTFTVLVSSHFVAGRGTYRLHYLKVPGQFVVPAGDQGGSLTGDVGSYPGAIDLADEDPWVFTACKNDPIDLQLNSTNFDGQLDLYGPDGKLVQSAGGFPIVKLAYTVTNYGAYTLIVSSYFVGGTGTYGLTANGLSDDLKLCVPILAGTNVNLAGVGGPSNAVFRLFTATNVTLPDALWAPILTNQFNQFGAFIATNVSSRADPQRYFQLFVP